VITNVVIANDATTSVYGIPIISRRDSAPQVIANHGVVYIALDAVRDHFGATVDGTCPKERPAR
jgi:hypothetical protein